MTPELPPEDVERVVRVQKLVRSRLARRRVAALAGGVYRKCFDVASGLAYYCNMRTGGASWFKPALLGKSDAEWLEFQPDQEQPGDVDARTSSGEGSTALPSDLKARATGDESPDAALDRLNSTEWHERFAESVAFQNKCRAEKLALVRRHRRQVARAMRDWDRKALADKQRARAGRLAQLASDNQQLKQSLRDGSSVSAALLLSALWNRLGADRYSRVAAPEHRVDPRGSAARTLVPCPGTAGTRLQPGR
jgi:hypothetical protein